MLSSSWGWTIIRLTGCPLLAVVLLAVMSSLGGKMTRGWVIGEPERLWPLRLLVDVPIAGALGEAELEDDGVPVSHMV